MAKTEPIRDKEQLRSLADFFFKQGKLRNYALMVMAIYTVMRISDLLKLKWEDVYDFKSRSFRKRLTITEQKTGKRRSIALNDQALRALALYFPCRSETYIFDNGRGVPLSRVQAWRIMHEANVEVGIADTVACHGLRKTWGYHAWTSQAVSPVIIMDIYNHSSFEITKRYLGVEQDDLDKAYLEMELL